MADGPLTSRLQKIREGDMVLVGRKATGTLIADNLLPGQRLLLLSTGTGLAPFASVIKDPDVYERFEKIILVHGCRQVAELAYGEQLVDGLRRDEFFGEMLADKLDLLSDRHPRAVPQSRPHHRPDHDRKTCSTISACRRSISTPTASCCAAARPCWKSCARCSQARGFTEGNHSEPGHFVIEKAFVER